MHIIKEYKMDDIECNGPIIPPRKIYNMVGFLLKNAVLNVHLLLYHPHYREDEFKTTPYTINIKTVVYLLKLEFL